MHSAIEITTRDLTDTLHSDQLAANLIDELPILLSLVIEDDGRPPRDSSWLSGFVGAGLSILFHLWLIFTLAGIVFDERDPLDHEPIETRFNSDPVPEVIPELREFELANPDDREFEVQKAINASSIGLEFTNKPVLETSVRLFNDFEPNPQIRDLPHFDIPLGIDVSKASRCANTRGHRARICCIAAWRAPDGIAASGKARISVK